MISLSLGGQGQKRIKSVNFQTRVNGASNALKAHERTQNAGETREIHSSLT